MSRISVVFNTYNQEKNLRRAFKSIKDLADEIVVADMGSTDDTLKIAKKFGAKIYRSKFEKYVEPVRNFAINKATHDWILVLDADEEVSDTLAKKLKSIVKEKKSADYYRIPRKNIIFGKWMENSGWWPDYNIRFFKKGHVSWSELIHAVPLTSGKGVDLEVSEDNAITHWHYSSIAEYLERLGRYTDVQRDNLLAKGYIFLWQDLLTKPNSEFLRRYFAEMGYKDGLHGLALSLLQSFSEAVLYLKLWESQKFNQESLKPDEYGALYEKVVKENKWWVIDSMLQEESNRLNKLWLKIRKKLKYQ